MGIKGLPYLLTGVPPAIKRSLDELLHAGPSVVDIVFVTRWSGTAYLGLGHASGILGSRERSRHQRCNPTQEYIKHHSVEEGRGRKGDGVW